MERPNILWYCTDQQRFDTLGCLGNLHINTPNVDRIAQTGAAFSRAYTQCPICTPSRATFLTGLYPAAHQVQRNGNDYFPAHLQLVPRMLADHGYDCGLIGKLHLSRAWGRVETRPDDGYRYFQWSHHPYPDWDTGHDYADWLRFEKGVDPRELFSSYDRGTPGAGVPAEYHQTTWCTEKALQFIDQSRTTPWMLSINPFDPHPPFDPAPEYLRRFDPETLPYPLFGEEDVSRQRAFEAVDQQTVTAVNPYAMEGTGGPTVASEHAHSSPPATYDSRLVKACYYAMIEHIDYELGRILDRLEQRGELENTVIIFTSDHGELLGDHGLILKGCRFFEGLVHVPLVMSFPRSWSRGTMSPALVELVDLAPTVLEAADIPVPPKMQGRSLVPLLTGNAAADVHKPHVVSEYYDAIDKPNGTHATMYFDGRYKSAVYHGLDLGELYDLEEDPGEFRNLFHDPASEGLVREVLRRHLDAVMSTVHPGPQRTGSY